MGGTCALQGVRGVSYKRGQRWPKTFGQVGLKMVGVSFTSVSPFLRHKNILGNYTLCPTCGVIVFLHRPQYEGALSGSSLDTLFPFCLNQRKICGSRRCSGALPYPGYSRGPGDLPGQHEVRRLPPPLKVPFIFSAATWQNRHWTSWVPR